MTGEFSIEVVARSRPGPGAADFALVPAREEPHSGEADFSNVVPFVRPRASDAARTAPEIVLPADAVRRPDRSGPERLRIAAFVALSLLLHSSLLAMLWHEPPPLASIGLEVMSVEVVFGAIEPSGIKPAHDQQATEPEQTAEKATEQPQQVAVAEKETAPEVKPEPKAEEPKPEEPKPFETAAAPPQQVEQPKPPVAMVETPQPDTPTEKPRQTPPDTTAVTLLPQPEEKPAEKKPEPKPEQAAPPKPMKNAAPARDNRRIEAPTRDKPTQQAKITPPPSQASDVGVGRSAGDSNYNGLVAAHLRRYQQYPSDARSRGEQGTATVSFSLDGGGRVTSARLARASGIASIDSEVQAMVRRASPFPAPPGGRAQSFTVPVNFRLN